MSRPSAKLPPENGVSVRPPPAQRAPVLTKETQDIFARFEKEMGLPLLAYWTSSGGSICQNDVMAMAQLLETRKHGSAVGLFLKSDGGNPEAALRLVHLLRSRFKRVVLYAPFECASAATMVALGANEIHMGPTSYLTAVDTSLKHQLSPVDSRNEIVSVSQDEVSRILRLWKEQRVKGNPYPEVYRYLHPLVIGALDRSSSLSIRICQELLSYHMPTGKRAAQISRQLNSTYPSHSYPITAREARKLGLSVRDLGAQRSLAPARTQRALLPHGQPHPDRLRPGKSSQPRNLQHPRNPRPPDLLPGRQGLALPQGRAPLDRHQRQVRLAARHPQKQTLGFRDVLYSMRVASRTPCAEGRWALANPQSHGVRRYP